MRFPKLHNFWLPPAYVLSLAETPEREQVALSHLRDDLGFSVTPYRGFHGRNMGLSSVAGKMTQGMIGCQLSHMSLWKMLEASDEEAFLVFEDDVLLAPKAKSTMEQAYRFSLPINWNMVFWGYCWCEPEQMTQVNQSFSMASLPPMCGHAYMIRKSTAKHLLPRINCDAPIDVQIRPLLQEIGGVYVYSDPAFARQRSLVYTQPGDEKVPVVSEDHGIFQSQTCERKAVDIRPLVS